MFVSRVESGQLIATRIRHNHLTQEKAARQEQPYCTHSQAFEYHDGAIRVAVVHQYLLPDGLTLGGSGMPDPKYLEIHGVIYAEWIRNTWYKKAWYWGAGWAAGIRYKLIG